MEISAESLRQWTVDLDGLTRALARALSLTGRRTALLPGRLWRLGRTEWQGWLRAVLLARGLDWVDGATVAARIDTQIRPVVLLADRVSWATPCPDRRIPVISLAEVTSLSDRGLGLDLPLVAAAMQEADLGSRASGNPPPDNQHRRVELRRQVKAELKSHLTDDLLAAAYQRCGSYREAARALSEQTGGTITKDQVFRAVRRQGGLQAVVRCDDRRST